MSGQERMLKRSPSRFAMRQYQHHDWTHRLIESLPHGFRFVVIVSEVLWVFHIVVEILWLEIMVTDPNVPLELIVLSSVFAGLGFLGILVKTGFSIYYKHWYHLPLLSLLFTAFADDDVLEDLHHRQKVSSLSFLFFEALPSFILAILFVVNVGAVDHVLLHIIATGLIIIAWTIMYGASWTKHAYSLVFVCDIEDDELVIVKEESQSELKPPPVDDTGASA